MIVYKTNRPDEANWRRTFKATFHELRKRFPKLNIDAYNILWQVRDSDLIVNRVSNLPKRGLKIGFIKACLKKECIDINLNNLWND